LQEEQLGDHEIRNAIVNRRANEDDAVLQQAGVNVHAPLAAAGVLDDERDVVAHVVVGSVNVAALPS
jgi:hypothetical protein